MLHFSPVKMLLVLATCLAGLLFSMPNFFSKDDVKAWPTFLQRQIPLGLDLQGGAHLLLEMETPKLKTDWIANLREDARRTLRDAKIGFASLNVTANSVQLRTARPEDVEAATKELRKLVQNIGNDLLGTTAPDLQIQADGGTITLTPTDQGLIQRIRQAQSAAIETINRRINALGTAEATVVPHGRDRILIQYPGLQDTTQLKNLIGQTAKLTFHEVHPSVSAEEARQTRPPTGYRVYPSLERTGGAILLKELPVVDGQDLVDAQPSFDQRDNGWVISFRFNQSGARKFGAFTRDHVNQPFAIVLDDRVISAPVIREPILGGSGQISGGFTAQTAGDLSISLRSGALPAKLTIVEERTVGPSLGADSIAAGKLAGIIGGIATILMTVTAYGTFGIFACLALIANGLILVAIMSLLGLTLTLPGIAGLVLTIGMAVDANVLIYERIREELRAGKTPIAAIDAGFSRAIITIADSQLTTLAAAIIMFWLGSGPIRGFAVTLTIGIFTSVFTAVTVTRLLVALWLRAQSRALKSADVPI
jgi:protein-export membrane protein SecD